MTNKFKIITTVILAFMAVALWATFNGYQKVNSFTTLDKYSSQLRKDFPAVEHISTSTLAGLAKSESLLLIDCRKPEEFLVSHLPNAVNLATVEAIQLRLQEHPQPNRQIAIYCSVGARSAELSAALTKAGVADVKNVVGSIFQWANEGRPIVDNQGQPASKVHPFNKFWSRHLSPGLASEL